MFIALGLLIFYLAITNNLISHSSYQVGFNIYLTHFIEFIGVYTKFIPEWVWAAIFLVFSLAILKKAFSEFSKSRKPKARKEGENQ